MRLFKTHIIRVHGVLCDSMAAQQSMQQREGGGLQGNCQRQQWFPLLPCPLCMVVPPARPAVPALVQLQLQHPLHAAVSPLLRALPDYEAQFAHHLAEARAYWEASQQRMHAARQLLSEQEVQARAADAARANVEAHYAYILDAAAGFVDR